MVHKYSVYGMSCKNCRTHVEESLKKIEGVTSVSVDLQKGEADIEMTTLIPLEKFQKALEKDEYGISLPGDKSYAKKWKKDKEKSKNSGTGSGIFYCPMHC